MFGAPPFFSQGVTPLFRSIPAGVIGKGMMLAMINEGDLMLTQMRTRTLGLMLFGRTTWKDFYMLTSLYTPWMSISMELGKSQKASSIIKKDGSRAE
jgi:hypothetical protein